MHVDGDPARLEQVLNNLLDNAIKYTPGAGRVTVTIERVGETAVLRVRDTGQGIRTDLLARVFDLFVQEPQSLDRSRGGLGLGLALVKRLVELHGGSVAVWSAGPGQGSEFTVRLPAVAAPVAATGRRRAGAPPAAMRSRRRAGRGGQRGRAPEPAPAAGDGRPRGRGRREDGPSGLARLQAFKPDVALIDLGLPGMDGYAVAREAREAAARPARSVSWR